MRAIHSLQRVWVDFNISSITTFAEIQRNDSVSDKISEIHQIPRYIRFYS